MAKWVIYCGKDQETFVSKTVKVDTKELLGYLIALWSRDRIGLQEWDDVEKMAAIAFYYTDLGERDIRGIFGESGRGAYPGEPPWELQHPDEPDEILRIKQE